MLLLFQVYDIDSGEWNTYTLPEQYQVSDHASFPQEPSYVYIAGGYDQNYTALSMVSRIVVSATVDDGALSIEEVAPLDTARGDIYGVTAQDGSFAFVSGGFTHEDLFCDPLASTEEYNFENDNWKVLPDLVNPRGEIVLVELDNHLYSLGGERQIEGVCDLTGETNPGELTVGTDLVEVFEKTTNAWKVVTGFPEHKFRFAAVGVGETGLIYAFGGQTAFDDDCQCFKTTDDVSMFGEGVSSGTIMSLSVLCSVVSVLSIGLIMM
jgi:N-acetylneuraminic acid mutarotase